MLGVISVSIFIFFKTPFSRGWGQNVFQCRHLNSYHSSITSSMKHSLRLNVSSQCNVQENKLETTQVGATQKFKISKGFIVFEKSWLFRHIHVIVSHEIDANFFQFFFEIVEN